MHRAAWALSRAAWQRSCRRSAACELRSVALAWARQRRAKQGGEAHGIERTRAGA
jgi:hypothetical protein